MKNNLLATIITRVKEAQEAMRDKSHDSMNWLINEYDKHAKGLDAEVPSITDWPEDSPISREDLFNMVSGNIGGLGKGMKGLGKVGRKIIQKIKDKNIKGLEILRKIRRKEVETWRIEAPMSREAAAWKEKMKQIRAHEVPMRAWGGPKYDFKRRAIPTLDKFKTEGASYSEPGAYGMLGALGHSLLNKEDEPYERPGIGPRPKQR